MPAQPDIIGAFIDHALGIPAIVAEVGASIPNARITGQRPKNEWNMPKSAVVFTKVPGPVRTQPGTVPIISEPIQWECYGTNQLSANNLALLVSGEFFPEPPTPQGFITAHCAVISIEVMGAAAPLQEDKTDWPRSVGTWLVTYCLRRV